MPLSQLTPALAYTGFAAALKRDDTLTSSVFGSSASATGSFTNFGNTSSAPDKCKNACAPWLQTLDNNGTCISYLDVAPNGDGKGFDDEYLGLNCNSGGKTASLQLLCNVSVHKRPSASRAIPGVEKQLADASSISTSSRPAGTASSRTRSLGTSRTASSRSRTCATSAERLCRRKSRASLVVQGCSVFPPPPHLAHSPPPSCSSP